jgi:hypothetical protein
MLTSEFKDNKWSVEVGRARVLKIANRYRDLGYLVITNDANHSGADLIIISLPEGRIKKVIEVTNYKRPNEYMDDNRVERYIGSLTNFEDIDGIELELVVSFLENLTAKQLIELKKNSIQVHVEGSQDLPENKPIVGWKD